MVVEARVLKIDEKKTVFGILNQNGSCGTGSCEGCSCSRKLKTISLPTSDYKELAVGADVLIHQDSKLLLHFFLILALPILILLGIQLLPQLLSWAPEKNILNMISMGGGLTGFFLMSFLVSRKKKKMPLRITVKKSNP